MMAPYFGCCNIVGMYWGPKLGARGKRLDFLAGVEGVAKPT